MGFESVPVPPIEAPRPSSRSSTQKHRTQVDPADIPASTTLPDATTSEANAAQDVVEDSSVPEPAVEDEGDGYGDDDFEGEAEGSMPAIASATDAQMTAMPAN